MADPQKALATQLANIQTRTGKTLAELTKVVEQSGLTKHGQIRDMLKETFGLGYGDANTLAHVTREPPAPTPTVDSAANADAAVDSIYVGPKAALRPIHDKLMAAIQKLGAFEIAPKKTYLSLRRKKQFAMIGPATNTQVEVGLNTKASLASDRLVAQPAKSMCNYKCRLSSASEANTELIGWIRQAYDEAG